MTRASRGPGGVVYSSGLGLRARGAPRKFTAEGGPFLAVVLATYVMGDPDAGADPSEGASSRIGLARVEADVVLIRSGVLIPHVPVMPHRWGINGCVPWVPRKTTRTISGNQPLTIESVMDFRGNLSGSSATALDDVDGDIVLVDFVENDIHFPIVRDVYPHPRSKRPIIEGTGWDEANSGSERGTPHDQEHYFRYAGVEARINDDGDVLLDTVGATSDKVDEDPNTGAGQVRVRMKASERLTVEMDGTDVLEVWKDGSQVKIDLGEGADQRIPLGDDQVDALKDAFDAVLSFANALATATPTSTGGIPVTSALAAYSGSPAALLASLTQAKSDLDAALSDLSRTKRS